MALLLAATVGCQEHAGGGEDPAALARRLLHRNHGGMVGQMGQCLMELRRAGDPRPTTVALDLPRRLRLDTPDGMLLLDGERGWRCAQDRPAEELDAAATADLRLWRALLAALVLEPLREPQRVQRQGPTVLAVTASGGETWRLEFDPTTLTVRSWIGPPGETRLLEFLETPSTRFPSRARFDRFGEREVRFLLSGVVFEDLVFQDPATAIATTRPSGPRLARGGERRPARPEVQSVPARLWLVLDDPGTWRERSELLLREGEALAALGQVSSGLPVFFREAGRELLAIPFEPDAERGARPFVPRAGMRVVRTRRHMALVVFPERGTFATAVASGRSLLDAHLAEKNLRAAGPLRAIPYLALDEGPPTPAQLERLQVKLELPLGEWR
ncbi:MAG: hypothetical protein IT458_07550 [Planctomycetes bacterium]|nr:hypothetical protein [Planctomycetota bacterium]